MSKSVSEQEFDWKEWEEKQRRRNKESWGYLGSADDISDHPPIGVYAHDCPKCGGTGKYHKGEGCQVCGFKTNHEDLLYRIGHTPLFMGKHVYNRLVYLALSENSCPQCGTKDSIVIKNVGIFRKNRITSCSKCGHVIKKERIGK